MCCEWLSSPSSDVAFDPVRRNAITNNNNSNARVAFVDASRAEAVQCRRDIAARAIEPRLAGLVDSSNRIHQMMLRWWLVDCVYLIRYTTPPQGAKRANEARVARGSFFHFGPVLLIFIAIVFHAQACRRFKCVAIAVVSTLRKLNRNNNLDT